LHHRLHVALDDEIGMAEKVGEGVGAGGWHRTGGRARRGGSGG
jgi:hypothetical protein